MEGGTGKAGGAKHFPPHSGGALTPELARPSRRRGCAKQCTANSSRVTPPPPPLRECVTGGGGRCSVAGWVWVASQVRRSATFAPPPASPGSAPPRWTCPRSQYSARGSAHTRRLHGAHCLLGLRAPLPPPPAVPSPPSFLSSPRSLLLLLLLFTSSAQLLAERSSDPQPGTLRRALFV